MITSILTSRLIGCSFLVCNLAVLSSPHSASSFNVNSEPHNIWWTGAGDYPANPPSPSHSYNNNNNEDGSSSSLAGGLVSNSNSQNLKSSSLALVHFSNKSITCNDGSTAGYYIRKSPFRTNPVWIIFLEGGWYCFDERSCQNRWMRLKSLMSSSGWSPLRSVGGILSSDPSENPYWWNANHVLVPYCSSDTWSGTVMRGGNDSPFSFMGALIIDQVIRSLISNEGLNAESTLILAGSSAGGTGVMINLDRVESILREEFGVSEVGSPRVRGIADSGWFIDKLPSFSEKVDCHDVILCPPEISLRKGMNLWNARLPENCQNSYPDDPWSCFFGYKIYPTLKAPLFVFQWLFDEAQMLVNNVPTPALRKEEWDYVYRVGDELKKTLINVTSVMIPSCISHTILTHRDWKRVEVNSVYLPRALKCWESGGIIEESNFIPSRRSSQRYWDEDEEEESSLLSANSEGRGTMRSGRRRLSLPSTMSTSSYPSSSSSASASSVASSSSSSSSSSVDISEAINSNDSSRKNRRRHNRHRHNKRHRRRRRKKFQREKVEQELVVLERNNISSSGANRKRNSSEDSETNSSPHQNPNRHNSRKHLRRNSNNSSSNNNRQSNNPNSHNNMKHNKKKRNRRWFTLCDGGTGTAPLIDKSQQGKGSGGGDMRLIEKCSWPQCNKSCPKLLNPLTGEEVDFKDLLKSFGLDMATMAKALGIDLATLNSMDHQVLLQMLTQHA